MKRYLKPFAVSTACCLALSGMPVFTAHAETVQKIVVLGDSISSSEDSYIHYVEDCVDVEIQNFAKDSYTTADILSCLSDETVKKALSEADIILINGGEHDVNDSFLVTTTGFMEEFHFEKFLDVFQARIQDYGFESEDELTFYSNKLAAEIRKNQKTANENLQLITQELDNYSNAKIIWQTAYNMLDTIEIYDEISPKRQMAYNAIMKPERTVLSEYINKPILEFADSHENCSVVDVYTAFLGNAYQYTHLYDLDFNPTFSGHKIIAEKVISELNLSKLGDVNNDNEINAKDAAAVLVHSASVGANNGGTLTDEQLKSANVNSESEVNSKDAAQILVYAASAGAGKEFHFQKNSNRESEDKPSESDLQKTSIESTEEFSDPDETSPLEETEELSEPDETSPLEETEELSEPDETSPLEETEEFSEPDETQPPEETEEFSEPDETQPPEETEEFSEPDETQPPEETEEFSEPDETQPPEETEELADPDKTSPLALKKSKTYVSFP